MALVCYTGNEDYVIVTRYRHWCWYWYFDMTTHHHGQWLHCRRARRYYASRRDILLVAVTTRDATSATAGYAKYVLLVVVIPIITTHGG